MRDLFARSDRFDFGAANAVLADRRPLRKFISDQGKARIHSKSASGPKGAIPNSVGIEVPLARAA